MAIPAEIKAAIEKSLDLMISQTKAYLPFLRVAFPGMRDLNELVFNMMIGNALTVLISQYAMRMQSPTEEDFVEFGKIAESYRGRCRECFD